MFPGDYLLGPYPEHEEQELQFPPCGLTWCADGHEVERRVVSDRWGQRLLR